MKAYLVPAVSAATALFGSIILLLGWWVAQGCVDDPCNISTRAEWRGILVLFLLGALFLRLASWRYWPHRVFVFALPAIPAYLANRDVEPTTFAPINSEAPAVAAIGPYLLSTYVLLVFVTLIIDWIDVRRNGVSSG